MTDGIVKFLHSDTQNIAVTEKRILACAEYAKGHGIVIDSRRAALLAEAKTKALRATGRVEFGGGIMDLLIECFIDSPYISQENFKDTLCTLADVFCEAKNAVSDRVSDRSLAVFLRNAYDRNGGSADLGGEIEGLVRRLSEAGGDCDELAEGYGGEY